MTEIVIDFGSMADWFSSFGAVAAVFTALWGFHIAEKNRRSEQRDRERSIGYETIAALLDILNHLRTIEKCVCHQKGTVIFPGEGNNVTIEIINPPVGLSREGDVEIPFGATELLVRAKQLDLWNDIRLLLMKNRALTYSLKEYKSIWEDLFLNNIYNYVVSSADGGFVVDPSKSSVLHKKLDGIRKLGLSIEDELDNTVSFADSIACRIGPALKEYFNEPFLHLAMKDGAQE